VAGEQIKKLPSRQFLTTRPDMFPKEQRTLLVSKTNHSFRKGQANSKDSRYLLYRSAVRFSGLFQTNSIRYFILGGYALIYHGIVRNTTDIDMVVNESDFDRASQVRNLFWTSNEPNIRM
jgi:hypothetical protein